MARTYDDSMFKDTFEHEYTWLNGFRRNVRRFAERPAVIDAEEGRSWNYEELDKETNRLANALKDAGLKKNDVIMVAVRNSPSFAFCYIGPRKIGCIILAANFNLSAKEMALLMDFNKPKAVVYSANAAAAVCSGAALCEHRPALFIMADNIEQIKLPSGHILYEDFVSGKSEKEPSVDFRPHIYDEVIRLCTSGTTSLPKCVPLNDINEVLSAHDVIMHYPMDKNDVTLNMTPWFHRGGCHCGGPCPSFYVGAAVLVMRKFQPQTALEWVSKYHVTFLLGAPSNLEMLCRVQERKNFDISFLHGIVTMGAPISSESCRRYMKVLTKNIFNGYGTTETFWNSFLRPYDLPEGAGTVGNSCIDDEVRVVKIFKDRNAEPEETVAQDGSTEGEVIVFCPEKTTYSYFSGDGGQSKKFYKGWVYTGDTGTWDRSLKVTVKGRKDDMMVISGENIYPSQVEDALMQNPKVKDCLVTSVPDSLRGEAMCAYVVANDSSLTIEELKKFCAQSEYFSSYKRPRYFALVDSVPVTATGKKMHSKAREQAPKDLDSGILKKG